MAKDSKTSCKVKDNKGDTSTGPGAETSNATGPRRSGRETPSKKNSPPSVRKSELSEKRTPTPPAMRKSKGLEQQSTPNALRRSERGKNQSSSSSSGSKNSNKLTDLSSRKKKLKKGKSVGQLTLEPKQDVKETAQMGQKIKTARAYKEIFKQKTRKLDVLDSPSRTGKISGEKVPDLRDVSTCKDSEKTSSCELLEIDGRQESSNSTQNIRTAGAFRSEDQDSVKDSKGAVSPLHSADKAISRKLDLDAETDNKNINSELVSSTLNERAPDSDVRLESSYKETSLKRKRDNHDLESDSTVMASSKDICPSVPDAINYSTSGNKLGEICAICFNRKSDNHGSKQEEHCLCGVKSNQIISAANVAQEGNGADINGELNGKPNEGIQVDGDQNTCLTCKLGGKLLCCEGKGCKRSYHVSCLDPPLKDIPLEVWYCLACVDKKIKLGEHSVSEGVESIWKVEMSEENGSQKKHFFVKYKGLAHVHNRWVSESLLLLQAPSLLAKFNRKNQVSAWKDEWTEPHRMLQKRLLRSPMKFDEVHGGHADDVFLWLVKWRGLDYEKATWEFENASFMKLPKAQSLIRDYESRLERAKNRTHKEIEIEKGPFKPMQLSAGCSTEIDFFNSLCERWHRGQNVIIMDDQDRIMKVITFIASLSSDGRWPFLIITSSAASWDEEFLRLAPSIATVVYHGSKDTRRKIRAVEFYAEGGGVMLDVLVTSPEVVVEDRDVLQSITWEAVILDDCQRSRMYTHFEQFKSLSTKMRLLLVNGQLKDAIIEHLLPLLDCPKDVSVSEALIPYSDHRIHDLKEKLSKYIIDSSKSDTSRFIEYWVPAQISSAQLEQYCATLLANSLPLCSTSKNDPVGVVHDIVISNRKCCDHPYITDSLLPQHLTKDLSVTDFLDVGIKASGKLQLLDAMLVEIRNKGLRVLVLFQSSSGNIGDILDDFVRQRFGENSYERLEALVTPGRKHTALNKFNSEKSRFVFLLETRACSLSIKLSSVDAVIIFGSDWNPANDLRSLQKITLDTQAQQLKVFRLYSSFTVEENALILAKHRKRLDSNLQSISRATGQNLLMWGVSYLFCKLDEFHGLPTVATGGSSSFEPVSHEDVIRDFLNILSQPQNAKDTASNFTILKAKQNNGNYSTDFPLPGEKKIQESDADLPHIFWKKLLDKKQRQWKYTSGLSQCNRKRAQQRDEVFKEPEGEIEEVVKKRKKVINNNFDQASARLAAAENDGLGAVPNSVRWELNSGSSTHLNESNTNNSSTLQNVAHNKPEPLSVDMAKFGERTDMRESQKSLHALLKPEIEKLCEILQLPEDVKAMAQSFLEYVMNNHCVIKEPATVLQAFHISLCWTAASILKYKVDRKESLDLARKHLQFGCKKEEADYVYSMLRCLKKMFIYRQKNLTMAVHSTETSDSLSNSHNKVHHDKSSEPEPAILQQEKDKFEDLAHGQEVDDQVLSQLGQHGVLRSIKDIEKKCDKQKTKLLQKQQEEISEHKRNYENEKAQLENKKKTEAAVIRLHSSSSMRADKLMQLDIEYKEKFEELNRRMEVDLENLQKKHKAAMEMVEKRKENWLQGVISWAKRDFIANTGNASSLNPMENMRGKEIQVEIRETVSTSDDPEVLITGVKCTGKPIPDGENANIVISKNTGYPETSSTEAIVAVTTMPRDNCSAPVMACGNDTHLNQQVVDNAAPLPIMAAGAGAAKSASDKASGHTTGEQEDEEAVDPIVNEVSNGPDNTTGATQENEDIPSGQPENPGGVEVCETREQHGAVPKTADAVEPSKTNDQMEKVSESLDKSDGQVVDKNTVNENSGCEERTTVLAQQNEDNPSGVPEIAGQVRDNDTREQLDVETTSAVPKTADVDNGKESGYKQDGTVQATENVDNIHSQSLDNSDKEFVPEVRSAPDEVADNICSGDETSGVPEVGPTLSVRPSQQDELIISQNLENDPRPVEGEISGDGVSSVNNEDNNNPHASAQAYQEQNMQETASTRSEDRLPSATEIDNADVPIAHPVLQMPPPDTVNAMDLPAAGESEANINNAECSTQMLGAQVEQTNQAVSHFPVETPIGGSGMHVPISSGPNNSSTRTTPPPVQMPHVASSRDPLQNELERIRKETDHVISIHENTKLQLKADLEKEIQEIRRKYETKFQEVESEFISRKKELDLNQHKVLMNKILAEAFRSKCMDIKGSTPTLQQDVPSSFLQQLLQLSSQPTNLQRNIPGLSRPSPPAAGPQVAHRAAPSLGTMHRSAPVSGASSMHPVHHSSAPVSAAPSLRPAHRSSAPPSVRPMHQSSRPVTPTVRPGLHMSSSPSLRSVGSAPGNSTRPSLVINSISPAAGTVQAVTERRGPAPHLQSFRPAAPTNPPSPAIGIPSQQVPINPAATQLQPQPASHVQQQCEAMGIVPPLPSSAVREIETLMNVRDERNSNLPGSSIQTHADLGSNTDPTALPEDNMRIDELTHADDVVCLSDDD